MMAGNAPGSSGGLDDTTKPLRSKLLAVPEFRPKNLADCREIATRWLDWKMLEPTVTQTQALIAADFKIDTPKLNSFEEFQSSAQNLKAFADARRAFVLNYGGR